MIIIHSATASEVELLVWNGEALRPDVHNYLVMLHSSLSDPERYYMCSGSIIDKEWIITAAHCIINKTKEIKISQKIYSEVRLIGYGFKYIIHPNYIDDSEKSYNIENDVALVKTLDPIEFNVYTQPIPLSWLRAFGQQAIIAGYGISEFGVQVPMEGTVIVTPCKTAPWLYRNLCSQSLAFVTQGDSGGALTTDDGLVGVVSSLGMDNESIFVNISLHYEFIQEVTGIVLHGSDMESENID